MARTVRYVTSDQFKFAIALTVCVAIFMFIERVEHVSND